MKTTVIRLYNETGTLLDEIFAKDGVSVTDAILSSNWEIIAGDTIKVTEHDVDAGIKEPHFMPLEFKVNDIPEDGSCFAFTATLTEEDLFYRTDHAKNAIYIHIEGPDDRILTLCDGEDRHIATYNGLRRELYTSSRELFCQMGY